MKNTWKSWKTDLAMIDRKLQEKKTYLEAKLSILRNSFLGEKEIANDQRIDWVRWPSTKYRG